MPSPTRHVVKAYSCRCRNITINAYDIKPRTESTDNYEQAFVGEDGIQIVHLYLTLRIRDRMIRSSEKFVQHLNLHCLECKTKAYRIVQEIPPGLEAREGPVTPSEGWVEQNIMASRTGWIEVLLGPDGCLAGNDAIETHFQNLAISNTFSIAIPPGPSTSSTVFPMFFPPQPTSTQGDSSSNDIDQSSNSLNILNLSDLPPLFPPPPFTPSHPVFQLLSTHATSKCAEWRAKVEQIVRDFLKLQLDDLKHREEGLRAEVDAIWKNYREGWKDITSRTNEPRQETTTHSDIASHGSKKPSIPVSIRDFSPTIPSGTLDTIQSPSNHNAPLYPVSSPITSSSINRNRPVFGSFNSKSPTAVHNEASHVIDLARLSFPNDRGELSMSAFKRNMDASVDIATSLRWAEGEEALRKRFEAKNEDHRARKRTSKNLSITSKDVKADSDDVNVEPLPAEQIEQKETPTTEASGDQKQKIKKQKRRVTFDVKPDEPSQSVPARVNPLFTEELFDLDDFPPTNSPPIMKDLLISRNPVYKMHYNPNGTELQDTQAASLPLFSNAFKPFSPLHPKLLSVNGVRRRPGTLNLSEALPLLSSSVPANDRIIPARISSLSKKTQLPTLLEHPSKDSGAEMDEQTLEAKHTEGAVPIHQEQQSIPLDATSELELRNLFAASAPSHRHAWKEGGSAWKMFHRFSPRSPIHGNPSVEDDGEDPLSEAVSDSEDHLKHPAPLARSLPIAIQPPLQIRGPLEPKTSLADKQGVLVPPLKVNNHKTSSAMRKAVYADRDLSRSVDPGPTLGLDDYEETEEESPEVSNVHYEDRGRRHALSILQARSAVPEAGMWRSLAA